MANKYTAFAYTNVIAGKSSPLPKPVKTLMVLGIGMSFCYGILLMVMAISDAIVPLSLRAF